jgi:hypothetical protein
MGLDLETVSETKGDPAAFLLSGAEQGAPMRRLIHRNFVRSRIAQRAAVALMLGLLAMLAVSVVQLVRGVSS